MESVLRTEIWRHLPVKTIKHLSLCGKTTRCDLQKVLQHVLKRDFNEQQLTNESQDAKDMYLRYYKIIKYFTSFIPMITETTIRIIDKYVSFNEWYQIKCGYKDYSYKPKVLNAHLLLEIIGAMLGEVMAESCQDDEYYEEREHNGDDDREIELEDLLNTIEKYLLDKYSVKRAKIRRGLTRSPDYKNLESHLTPTYVISTAYTSSKRILFNGDQDYLFTLVEYGIPVTWSAYLSGKDFEGANRFIVLSESDM